MVRKPLPAAVIISSSLLGMKRAWMKRIASAEVFLFSIQAIPLYRHVPCVMLVTRCVLPADGMAHTWYAIAEKDKIRVNKRKGRGTPYFIIADTSIMHPTPFHAKHKKASLVCSSFFHPLLLFLSTTHRKNDIFIHVYLCNHYQCSYLSTFTS